MVPISEKDWEFFSSKLIKREFAKKSIILKVGHKENYLSFIEKGIVRKCIPQVELTNSPLHHLRFIEYTPNCDL